MSNLSTGLEKYSFHSSSKEKKCQRMFKPPHNALISHTSKVMLKILQVRLQQYMNWELPDVQDGFTKGRGTRDQVANILWIIEKARESPSPPKKSTSSSMTTLQPLTVWITTKCGKFLKRWKYTTLVCIPLRGVYSGVYSTPEEPVCKSRRKWILAGYFGNQFIMYINKVIMLYS